MAKKKIDGCWIDKQHDRWDPKNEIPGRLFEFFSDVKLAENHEGGGAILLDANDQVEKIAVRLVNGWKRKDRREYTLAEALQTFGTIAVRRAIISAGLPWASVRRLGFYPRPELRSPGGWSSDT